MAAGAQGMKSPGFRHAAKPVPRAQHRQPAPPTVEVWHRRTGGLTRARPMTPDCGPPTFRRTCRHRGAAGALPCRTGQATARRRVRQYLELGDLADFYDRPLPQRWSSVTRSTRTPTSSSLSAGSQGLLAGAYLKKAGVDGVRSSRWPATSRRVWYQNRFPASSATTTPIATSRCWKNSASCRRRSTPTARRSSSTAATSENTSASDGALFSTRCANCAGTTRCIAGGSAPTAATHIRARFVVMAQGSYNRPKLPASLASRSSGTPAGTCSIRRAGITTIPAAMRTAAAKLADKRVALVGTGATGCSWFRTSVGCQAALRVPAHPSSVDARANTPTDPDWARLLQPRLAGGTQAELPQLVAVRRGGVRGAGPGVRLLDRTRPQRHRPHRGQRGPRSAERRADHGDPGEEDYKIMERLRRRIAAIVADPDTAETLQATTTTVPVMCKRPCSSEDLPAFNLPNVTLVDVSGGQGVDRLAENGIVANGVEYEVDCVIFASGFEISTEISWRYAVETIEGRDGLSLFDHWRDSYQTLHGIPARISQIQFFRLHPGRGLGEHHRDVRTAGPAHRLHHRRGARSEGATTVRAEQCRGPGRLGGDHPGTLDRQLDFELSRTPGYYNNEAGAAGTATRPSSATSITRLLRVRRTPGRLARRGQPRRPGTRELDDRVEVRRSGRGGHRRGRGLGRPTRCCWLRAGPPSSSTIPASPSVGTRRRGARPTRGGRDPGGGGEGGRLHRVGGHAGGRPGDRRRGAGTPWPPGHPDPQRRQRTACTADLDELRRPTPSSTSTCVGRSTSCARRRSR